MWMWQKLFLFSPYIWYNYWEYGNMVPIAKRVLDENPKRNPNGSLKRCFEREPVEGL